MSEQTDDLVKALHEVSEAIEKARPVLSSRPRFVGSSEDAQQVAEVAALQAAAVLKAVELLKTAVSVLANQQEDLNTRVTDLEGN